MVLRKPSSIHPPTESISPCVLGSHKDTFRHPTSWNVNTSSNSPSSLSASRSPPPPPLLFSWMEMKVNHCFLTRSVPRTRANTVGWGGGAFCNKLICECHVVWTSMFSFTVCVCVCVPLSVFTGSVGLGLCLHGTFTHSFR